MQKTAEAVSLGHPDKIADYISSYILDRMIEQDQHVKYAVEVMIKNNTVALACDTPPWNHPQNLSILRGPMEGDKKTGRCPVFYSANVPTDIVIRRIPLLMDFSLFTRAFNISPV